MSQQDSPQPSGTHPYEAQRIEAWAAVHRPETTRDELVRIAEAHPEFAPAIAAHPNAPASQPLEQAPQAQYAPALFSVAQSSQWAKPKVNIAGIIAFSLLVVVTVLEFFVPAVMHQAMLTYDISLMIGFPLIRLILALCAIAIGIVGARMQSQPRLRWMAVGSIVAGSFLAVPLLLSTLAYAAPGLLPYYGY